MLDLLFVTAQAPTAQVVIRTCEAAGLTCLVASDFEQLLSVIEEQEIKIIFIEIVKYYFIVKNKIQPKKLKLANV